jgi:hypothetical protein
MTFRAYVREVVCQAARGEWKPGTIGAPELVVGAVTMRPPEKVLKRLTDGAEDHVGHYLQTIMTAFTAGAEGQPCT